MKAIEVGKGRITLIVLMLIVAVVGCSASPAHARIDGVPYITLEVNGETFEVPVYNRLVTQKFYMIKQMLAGDEVARSMLLGTEDEELIFIGDGDTVRWLKITRTSQEVIEYN